jgi:hypothetical protein
MIPAEAGSIPSLSTLRAMEQDLTLREALAEDRLDDFVRQEEDRGVELAKGSDLERALALLVTQRRLEARSARSTAHGGEWA